MSMKRLPVTVSPNPDLCVRKRHFIEKHDSRGVYRRPSREVGDSNHIASEDIDAHLAHCNSQVLQTTPSILDTLRELIVPHIRAIDGDHSVRIEVAQQCCRI